jgi:hypothetical protein
VTDQVGDPSRFDFVPEHDQALDSNRCFLCGVELTKGNRADEHVFPKWILKEFDLYEKELNLLNETGIRYRQLTIPCCANCNTVWLSNLESEIAAAFREGAAAVASVPPERLGLWMSKIYYGILFKELSLPFERSAPESETIMDSEAMRSLASLHHLLQAARGAVEIQVGTPPASVFVFDTQDPPEKELRFDYKDLMVVPFLGLRLGRVGIVASLIDWNSLTKLEIPGITRAKRFSLQPIQFNEIAAICAHWRMRFNRSATYVTVNRVDQPAQVVPLPVGGMSALPVYDDFDPELFANLFSRFTGEPMDRLWNPESERFWTFLNRPDGEDNFVPLADGTLVAPEGGPPTASE